MKGGRKIKKEIKENYGNKNRNERKNEIVKGRKKEENEDKMKGGNKGGRIEVRWRKE